MRVPTVGLIPHGPPNSCQCGGAHLFASACSSNRLQPAANFVSRFATLAYSNVVFNLGCLRKFVFNQPADWCWSGIRGGHILLEPSSITCHSSVPWRSLIRMCVCSSIIVLPFILIWILQAATQVERLGNPIYLQKHIDIAAFIQIRSIDDSRDSSFSQSLYLDFLKQAEDSFKAMEDAM